VEYLVKWLDFPYSVSSWVEAYAQLHLTSFLAYQLRVMHVRAHCSYHRKNISSFVDLRLATADLTNKSDAYVTEYLRQLDRKDLDASPSQNVSNAGSDGESTHEAAEMLPVKRRAAHTVS
jgi:hypothetical protein